MNTLRYFDFGASRSLLLLIARIAVVVLFILFGYPKLLGFGGTVQYMAASGAPMPTLAAIIAVIMEVPAAILIVLGFFTRPLAVIFIFYTLGTAVIGHHYWDMTGDAVLPNMINFWKNVSIAGAFLLLAIHVTMLSGCKKDDGTNYTKDAYMSIYNNSDEIAYLDSLCIGTVNPVTSSSPSNFTKPDGSLWDEIPLFMMAWQFPGTGTDYPLQPGEETIIALNAINHVDIASQSVDLSKADFAFWDPLLTGASVPAPGVEPLKMLWRNSGTAFTISLTGPAMVIFKIPTTVAESAQAYAEDPGNLQLDPVKPNASQKFLMIHKDWVIDGVECVTSASKANKRIPNNIDAGFTYIPTSYLGNSVCRKVDEVVDGRTIYMDSNNSSEDFEVVPNTLKNR